MAQVIVYNETCGSVRSSLSALARLVTVVSEAAETSIPSSSRREGNREEAFETASINAVGGSGWVKSLTKVNCRRHRHSQRAKDADRLQPKGTQSVASHLNWGTRTHDCRCRGRDLINHVT